MQKKLFLYGLVALCLFAECRGKEKAKAPKNGKNNQIETVATQPKQDKAQNINVYIENSGSMDGYVNGRTEFKDAIRDLLVNLKYYYDEKNIKIYFINSEVHSAVGYDLSAFAENINTLWYVGDRAHSKLNNIFRQVLSRTDNHTVSILFSDYIYSIAGQNTVSLLSDEKSLTKDAFLTKSKKDKVPLATNIIKMKSKFKGEYYPYIGDSYHFPIDIQRPYYICIFGNQEILNDFNSKPKLNVENFTGFENKYVLSSEDPKNMFYSVLNFSYNDGRFKIDRACSRKDYVHGIKELKSLRGSDGVCFALAVDFSKVQAENDYICNPSNYEIPTDNFIVEKVFPLVSRDLHSSDWNMVKDHNPTHAILLRSTTKKLNNTEVSFVLKKHTPQWVYNSHTEDDTARPNLSTKTFGLKYWVEGIAEAYETIYPENKNYFECSISIK
jgi:hypothetical protein